MADKTIPVLKVLRGNVGIGSTTPTSNLEVIASGADLENMLRVTSGTAGRGVYIGAPQSATVAGVIDFRNGNVATRYLDFRGEGTSRMVIQTDGNVGIGTTAPAYELDVYSGVVRGREVFAKFDGVRNVLLTWGSASNEGRLWIGNNGAATVLINGNSTSYINNGANFGVGTSTPTRVLQVNGAAHATSHLVGSLTTALGIAGSFPDANDSELGPGYLVMTRDDTAAAKQLQFWKNGSLHSGLMTDTNGLNFVGSDGAADVTIKTDGKVGVGVTSPIRGLDLSLSVPAQYAAALINTSTTGHGLYIKGAPNHASYMSLAVERQDGSTNFVARGDGHFGIGTNAPNKSLTVVGGNIAMVGGGSQGNFFMPLSTGNGDGGFMFSSDPNNAVQNYGTGVVGSMFFKSGDGFHVSATGAYSLTDFAIKTDGNVGIGTNAPATKLEVKARASGGHPPLFLRRGATNESASLKLLTTTTEDWIVGMRNDGTSNFRIYSYGASSDVFSILRSNGNVGIGSATPAYALDVVGYAKVSLGIKVGGGSAGNSTNPAITVGSVNTAGVYFESSGVGFGSGSGTKKLFLRSDGDVGIGYSGSIAPPYGTTSPTILIIKPRQQSSDAALRLARFADDVVGLDIWADGGSGSHDSYFDNRYELSDWIFRSGTRGAGTIDEVMRVTGEGSVGIGTTAPGFPLHVKFDAAVAYNGATDLDGESIMRLEGANADQEAVMIRWANHGSMNNYFGVVQEGASAQGDFVWTSYGGSSLHYAERMRLRADGNVGINTTAPASKLQVDGEIRIASAASYNTHLNYLDGGTNYITTTNTGATYFRGSNNNITTMTVKGDGKVSINKAINTAVSLSINAPASNTTNYGLEICNASSNTRFLVDGVGNTTFYGSDNSVSARVTSDGKVGIGTATPQGAAVDVLQVGATASFPISLTTSYPSVKFNTYYSGGNKSHAAGYSSILYFDPAAGKLHYQPSAASVSAGAATSISTKFTIDSAGKVGINDSSPSYTLDVNGTFRVTGAATFDSSIGFATVLAGNGTASLPSFAFTNDPNTGMYNDGANDNLKFSTGGVVRAFLTATQWNVTGNIVGVAGIFSGAVSGTTGTFTGNVAVSHGSAPHFQIQQTSGNAWRWYADATDSFIRNGTGGHNIAKFAANGDVGFYNPDGSATQFFWDSSAEKLGIGTSSPSESLHIYRGSGPEIRLQNSTRNWYLRSYGDRLDIYITGTSLQAFTILADGKIGIGATVPAVKLHLDSGATTELRIDGEAHELITFHKSSAQKGLVGYSNSDSTLKLCAGSGTIASNVNGISINANGNVGIGTATPDTNLHVYTGSSGGSPYNATGLTVENNGRANIHILHPNGSDGYLFFGDANAGNRAYVGHYGSAQSPANQMVFYSAGNFEFANGKVGIGTAAPTYFKLDVRATGNLSNASFDVQDSNTVITKRLLLPFAIQLKPNEWQLY